MRYEKIFKKEQRENIFRLFLKNYHLTFTEIEKKLNLRSNEVAYHLKELVKEQVLEKHGDNYRLSSNAEKYLPFFSNKEHAKLNPLPVVLVAIMNKNQILLTKRTKRPYKDYWCMIGGKMYLDETVKETTERLVKEKTGLTGEFVSLNEVMHERVIDDTMVKHSFILFFTKFLTKDLQTTSKEQLQWFNSSTMNKMSLVPSDKLLLQQCLKKKKSIIEFDMVEKNGKLKRVIIQK